MVFRKGISICLCKHNINIFSENLIPIYETLELNLLDLKFEYQIKIKKLL